MDDSNDLRGLFASHHGLIVADVREESRFLAEVRDAAASLQYPVWTWSVTRGLARDGMGAQTNTVDPRGALGFVRDVRAPGVYVFLDAHPFFEDQVAVRLAKELALGAAPGQTVVLTGPDPRVPPELRGVALPWRMRPPSRAEMRVLVEQVVARLRNSHLTVTLPEGGVDALTDAVAGLTTAEAERVILRAAFDDGGFVDGDLERVRRAKAELLSADGPLELITLDASLDQVGGLDRLKAWLAERGRGFEPAAREFGLEPPRGVLLTGVPGCGKSLVAKSLARTWHMPLALLDAGRLYGSYVGESESRLRAGLEAVEVMSPVVLWVDEIEKGFAPQSGAGDGGVSQRVLATFLRWLQERPDGVFLVATANDVDRIPPELLRRGRFDEIFFVDLPQRGEREQIVRLHLADRRRDPAVFDLAAIAAATEGFSGAEIESVVVGALYQAFASGGDVTTELLLAEAAETVPLSRMRSEDVARIRAWATSRAVAASAPEL
ncbi:MAG: AAA family ATPase [Candidatus Nanopelagicales bacterium]